MENLRKAFASERYHPPRPWRSPQEMLMIRRLALQWWTCRGSKPPCRAWAREQLDVSHVWLLKLFGKFETDPAEVHRLQRMRDPTDGELDRARECTRRMRGRGKLRSPARKAPAIEPAMERFVRERFAQGLSKSRLARELFLDRRTVKRILQKV